jgi:hypothetical protein
MGWYVFHEPYKTHGKDEKLIQDFSGKISSGKNA